MVEACIRTVLRTTTAYLKLQFHALRGSFVQGGIVKQKFRADGYETPASSIELILVEAHGDIPSPPCIMMGVGPGFGDRSRLLTSSILSSCPLLVVFFTLPFDFLCWLATAARCISRAPRYAAQTSRVVAGLLRRMRQNIFGVLCRGRGGMLRRAAAGQ